ncbi:MAG: hypothetical protein M1826_006501 [Phylliscum demangeonii]|nr:MAG: hypothetical protein M1826_006501 [Phylliscum demangeonii]
MHSLLPVLLSCLAVATVAQPTANPQRRLPFIDYPFSRAVNGFGPHNTIYLKTAVEKHQWQNCFFKKGGIREHGLYRATRTELFFECAQVVEDARRLQEHDPYARPFPDAGRLSAAQRQWERCFKGQGGKTSASGYNSYSLDSFKICDSRMPAGLRPESNRSGATPVDGNGMLLEPPLGLRIIKAPAIMLGH